MAAHGTRCTESVTGFPKVGPMVHTCTMSRPAKRNRPWDLPSWYMLIMVTIMGRPMDGSSMDCSMDTPRVCPHVAPWHVSWTIDRFSNGRVHRASHDHSALTYGKCHGIMIYAIYMIFHGVYHGVAHGKEKPPCCAPLCRRYYS